MLTNLENDTVSNGVEEVNQYSNTEKRDLDRRQSEQTNIQ